MPKLRKAVDPWEKYRGAIVGRMLVMEIGVAELADRMEISVPTARKYLKDPGTMTLNQMRHLNRVLDIVADHAREVMVFK